MTGFEDRAADYQRRRWMRPDAHLWIRPDAYRWMPPGSPRWYGKDVVRYFWPEPQRAQPPQAHAHNYDPHQTRVPADDDSDLHNEIAALRFELVLIKHALRLRRKALHPSHFDPNQQRVPAGNPEGGQWTSDGGSDRPARVRLAGDPPPIPKKEPPTARERNRIIKEVAKWARKVGPVRTVIAVFEAASWVQSVYPYIQAYNDPPKTLEELQQAVSSPQKGYEIHHIVEQASAEQFNFPRSMIDAPENLVRIPRLKHWEINGYYGTPNERFDGLSPRDYLRERSWEERQRVGLEALIRFGVLKP